MVAYPLLYKLGITPWERTPGREMLGRILDGADAPPPGRALDIGCGTGRDAVYLAKRGWKVTAVDAVDSALAKARERATEEGVEVEWVEGDVSDLGGLGLEPGFTLIYDVGCIHGLSDSERASAVAGLKQLAAPRATALILAFRRARRLVLPRGMGQGEVVSLFGDGWELEDVVDVIAMAEESPPAPIRRAQPKGYRLRSMDGAA